MLLQSIYPKNKFLLLPIEESNRKYSCITPDFIVASPANKIKMLIINP